MIHPSVRLSIVVPALLALTLPVTAALGQAAGTQTTPKTTTTSTVPATGTAAPQGITGSDPTPIKWPPSAKINFVIE